VNMRQHRFSTGMDQDGFAMHKTTAHLIFSDRG
jgi:hypothetical protein